MRRRASLVFVVVAFAVAVCIVLPVRAEASLKGSYRFPVSLSACRVNQGYLFGTTDGGTRVAHNGVDITNGGTTPNVYAVATGTAYTYTGTTGYGNYVKVVQTDGNTTYYAHLSSISVANNSTVYANTLLGVMGASGDADGVHLHFEVRVGNNAPYDDASNPEMWLAQSETSSVGAVYGKITDTARQMQVDGASITGMTKSVSGWAGTTTYELNKNGTYCYDIRYYDYNFYIGQLYPGSALSVSIAKPGFQTMNTYWTVYANAASLRSQAITPIP